MFDYNTNPAEPQERSSTTIMAELDPPVLTDKTIHAAIESWRDKSPSQRKPLHTAVNNAAKILARNGHLLAGEQDWSCASLNRVLWPNGCPDIHLTAAAFRNTVTCLRTILIRLSIHADSRRSENRLSPAWQAFYLALPTDERRKGLIRFFRFLTLEDVTPETITEDAIDQFHTWCKTKILHQDAGKLSRRSAANWEEMRRTVPDWPQVQLRRADMRDQYGLSLEAFPQSFITNVDAFLGGTSQEIATPFRAGNPYRPLVLHKNSVQSDVESGRQTPRSGRRQRTLRTLETRRWQIKVAATALVSTGVPIEQITSLAVLVTPLEHAVAILDFHRERLHRRKVASGRAFTDHDLRSANLSGIGEILRQIAKFEAMLPDEEMAELKDYIAEVTPNTGFGLTDKNRTRLKALFEDPAYSMLLGLPAHWMRLADHPLRDPLEAARLAMYAAALEILLFLPLRRENLLQLRLDSNLRRPKPNALIDEIFIPAEQVKNRSAICWPVETPSARLLETYIRKHRQRLAEGGNLFLFPGIADDHRDSAEFGDRLSKNVAREIGAEFNCHLARHLAVIRYLRAVPGAYEIASNILGHRSPETTRKFYCGLEQEAAARHVNLILIDDRRKSETIPVGAYHQRHRVHPGNGQQSKTSKNSKQDTV